MPVELCVRVIRFMAYVFEISHVVDRYAAFSVCTIVTRKVTAPVAVGAARNVIAPIANTVSPDV